MFAIRRRHTTPPVMKIVLEYRHTDLNPLFAIYIVGMSNNIVKTVGGVSCSTVL
jgi:hypothetical protein